MNDLRARVSGDVLEPGQTGFTEAAQVWNARFTRVPAVVVRCRSSADVQASVRHARTNGLRVSVKGGGHSYGGRTVAAGGMLIDLSTMKGIDVRAEDRIVTVEPGVLTSELDGATQAAGLATPGVTVSTVGIAGAALGGGSGYLTRRHGLMVDNLVAADVVTASGDLVRASESENADLLWGLRGAGANLGVVTSFDLRLYEVGPEVLAGQIIYPFEDAAQRLRAFRDFMATAPHELQVLPFMFRVPPIEVFPERYHGMPVLDFVSFHMDPTAEEALAPLRGLGETVLDFVAPTPYVAAQQAFDASLPKGQRYYSKAHYLDAMSDDVIDAVVSHVPNMVGGFTSAYFEPLGGAAAQVESSAAAFGHRSAAFSFHIIAGWADAEEDATVMGWARGLHEAVAPSATGGVYVNLLGEDELDRVPAAYGDNFGRLTEVKGKWDSENVFAMNYNVPPAG